MLLIVCPCNLSYDNTITTSLVPTSSRSVVHTLNNKKMPVHYSSRCCPLGRYPLCSHLPFVLIRHSLVPVSIHIPIAAHVSRPPLSSFPSQIQTLPISAAYAALWCLCRCRFCKSGYLEKWKSQSVALGPEPKQASSTSGKNSLLLMTSFFSDSVAVDGWRVPTLTP